VREPSFWWRPHSWPSLVLAPFAWAYGAIAAIRLRQQGADIGIPVICVGNYTLGGAGKTPTVIALIELLRGEGQHPFVLSRGYRGTLKGPVLVDAARHTAAEVGDEPLLLAAIAPVVVSADRVAGARLAADLGAGIVVMDDGFQNPSLAKQLSLVVVDGKRGLGNGAVFPAGPLRAPLADQLERTDALVVIGHGSAADDVGSAVARRGGTVLRARLVADPADVTVLKGKRVLAFAGIGDPEKLFATLRGCGIEIAATKGFADHHVYSKTELTTLQAEAVRHGATLVTTAKDLARLGAAGAGISALKVALVFEDQAALRQLVARAVATIGSKA
jgi:tetraacyldisaccharide 4'-kinase